MELWSYEIDLLAKFGNLRDLPCGLTVTRGGARPHTSRSDYFRNIPLLEYIFFGLASFIFT